MSEPADLAYLCHHYGEAYEISMRRGRYEAIRRDDGTVLTANRAEAGSSSIRVPLMKVTPGADLCSPAPCV